MSTGDTRRDLRRVVAAPAPSSLFGWLTDFAEGRAAIEGVTSGLTVELEWDAALLPFAGIWQELSTAEGFPWFGRARVMAIEPASTPTSGPGRRQTLEIPALAEKQVDIALSVYSTAAGSTDTAGSDDRQSLEFT